MLAQAEVSYFDVVVTHGNVASAFLDLRFPLNQYVLWFQIPMYHALLVRVLNRVYELTKYMSTIHYSHNLFLLTIL